MYLQNLRMSCWGEEIETGMDTRIMVANQIPLNLQLLLKIAFKLLISVAHNGIDTIVGYETKTKSNGANMGMAYYMFTLYLCSLSIWSPNPSVETTVSLRRTLPSLKSNGGKRVTAITRQGKEQETEENRRTRIHTMLLHTTTITNVHVHGTMCTVQYTWYGTCMGTCIGTYMGTCTTVQ